ncbi:alpha/beta hydrolase [Nocardiopsis sp. N85]|uniref:alpha/beta fold hydrolase n=1 Tax=Nocardiopsis sp. N85 TaxID=3029400 RepID=UPI00237F84D7|nr:alpha/beta hydrolase [Nocardiopsis sp. N85]MDE3724867.1 alpha/beta hydrolase [Nocardiopsis sp. N85]
MPDAHPHGTHIYRSETGAREIRDRCEERIAAWPALTPLPEIHTALGTTRAFGAPGGDAAPVIVLSGTNFNSATSVDLARVLQRDRPVVLVDLPGQPGLSEAIRPRSGRAALYGAWFDEILPLLTDRPATVLAHSLGAAVLLAAKPSGLVRSVVMVGPAGLTAAAVNSDLMRVALPWMIGPRDDKSTRLLDHMSGPAYTSASHGGVHPFASWMTLVGRHCRTSLAPGPLPLECLRPWGDTPVILATGSDDVFYSPARLHGPARRLLDADVTVLEGAGHLAMYEQPERVAELVRSLD